jgi:hypothetical protein
LHYLAANKLKQSHKNSFLAQHDEIKRKKWIGLTPWSDRCLAILWIARNDWTRITHFINTNTCCQLHKPLNFTIITKRFETMRPRGGGCTWIKSWWGTEMPTYTDQKISNRISNVNYKILNELKKGIVCNDASQRMRCQICFLISQRTRQKKATKTDLFFDMTLKINLTCRSLALFLHLLCCMLHKINVFESQNVH